MRVSASVLRIVLALAITLAPAAKLGAEPLLMRWFGIGKKEQPAQQPQIRGGAKIIQVKPGGPAAAGAPAKRQSKPDPVVAVAPKDADARRILVIGDQLADNLARGLDVAFADAPKVRIDAAAVENAGIGRADPVDFAGKVTENLAGATAADAVVVMVGPGDLRPISVDGAEAEFRTAKWETVYRARVRALFLAARSRNVPVFVVGLVPMADIDLTTDIAYLDEILRQEAKATFTTYVNIWNEFADATGSFTQSGPDLEGQVKQLRLKDGVGFTRIGSRKLAFYVEREIRSWIERGAPGLVLPVTSGEGLVMSLTDPEAGLDEELAGAAAAPAPRDGSPLHDLVVLGRPPAPVAGRVDDL